MLMNLKDYLIFLNEQTFGVAPPKPVMKPQPSRVIKPKAPSQPQQPDAPKPKLQVKSYFNYMMWTSNILKQGEIFRKNCYIDNCNDKYKVGTSEKRICKDRCDIETCRKVIMLLKSSIGKCDKSKDPLKCKERYGTLIPLYEKKLNQISKKFLRAEKSENKFKSQGGDVKVG